MNWQPIESAPRDGTAFLATDDVLLGVGSHWTHTEDDWKFLGYDEGVRYPEGGLKIGPRFTERVPNPKAGEITSGWRAEAFHAFDGKTETINEDGAPRSFTPTRWMPLPEPPKT
jgi:hypothetical protein